MECRGNVADTDIKSLWNSTLTILKTKLADISFKTWIETIEPISLTDRVITLGIPSEFSKAVVETRYFDLIKDALRYASKVDTDIHLAVIAESPNKKPSAISESYAEPINEAHLNEKYTFETFAVGESNRLAYAMACKFGESNSPIFNPIYIYGDHGLGKTHLLHAIGHFVLKNNPMSKILYISVDKFVEDLVNHIRYDNLGTLKNKYAQADVLLIDNLQCISGKERTQEELLNICNDLLNMDKQIVLAGTQSPKEQYVFGERFSTIFDLGLAVSIEQPDFDTRVGILKKVRDIEKLDLPDDILAFIAEKIASNSRELRLALNRVIAYSMVFEERELNISLVAEALEQMV